MTYNRRCPLGMEIHKNQGHRNETCQGSASLKLGRLIMAMWGHAAGVTGRTDQGCDVSDEGKGVKQVVVYRESPACPSFSFLNGKCYQAQQC